MDVVLLLRLCGSAVFTTLGYVGHAWFKASDYNQKARHDEWTTCAGYTVQEFVGVALATVGAYAFDPHLLAAAALGFADAYAARPSPARVERSCWRSARRSRENQ